MISVIIPVYNVEKTIEKCLLSVINQTLKDLEIIIVNDGSTDNSYEICKKYANEDKRIKIITQKNGGLSAARNTGINNATGKYLLFLDSDDYIKKDSCEKLIKIAEENDLDVINANYIRVNKSVETEVYRNNIVAGKLYKGSDFLREILKNDCGWMMAWLNFCNREFIVSNQLYFENGRIHEDEKWTPIVLLKANRVMYLDYCFYYYVQNDNSIMNKKDKSKNTIHMFQNCKELSEIYNFIEDKELKELLMDSLVEKYLSSFYTGKFYKKKYKKYLNDEFLEGKAYKAKTIKKLKLYKFNRTIYYFTNLFSKIIKQFLLKEN